MRRNNNIYAYDPFPSSVFAFKSIDTSSRTSVSASGKTRVDWHVSGTNDHARPCCFKLSK